MKVKLVLMWFTMLAVALGKGSPVAAAELTQDRREGVPAVVLPIQTDMGEETLDRGNAGTIDHLTATALPLESSPGKTGAFQNFDPSDSHGAMTPQRDDLPAGPPPESSGSVDADPVGGLLFRPTAAKIALEQWIKERTEAEANKGQLAQFQVPSRTREGAGPARDKAREKIEKLPAALKFQYAYGSDSELTYLKNSDLNNRVRDDLVIFAPTLFGLMTYRPSAWFETTMEITLERQISLKEEDVVILPDGMIQRKEKRRWSLLIDQAYVTFKDLGPFDLSLGRKNFEDERLFLYDAALDGIVLKHKQGHFHTEASFSRENWVDGEVFFNPPTGSIDNYMLYSEYRGIVDNKLAAYAIMRHSPAGKEGRPIIMGVRAYGRPRDSFNYWTELGYCRGKDRFGAHLKGYGFEVGATYRFLDFPLQPSITLGVAFGSGDDTPDDNTNREFRQTGLQSNEGRFGGVTQFKRFGEFLDPELSNLWIFTAGVSFRLAGNAFLDIVYHYYRLHKIASELRSSGATALMNQDDLHLSKKVGNEIDIILGFRNLFGLRRFGFEVRAGLFLPGAAWRIEEGDPDEPTYRKANPGMSVLSVFIW